MLHRSSKSVVAALLYIGSLSIAVAQVASRPTETSISVSNTVSTKTIEMAIANTERSAAERQRDASSKPAAVLSFIGIAPGMTVLDLNAATGYYTELLSYVVGSTGHVIAHNHPGAKKILSVEDLQRRYGNERLPNVEQLFAKHNDLHLAAASVDAVWMSMVYHDTYWYDPKVDWGPIDQHALLVSLHDALKPDGVIGVIDHYAPTGSDPYQSAMATHRIDPAIVLRDFLAAGFVLEAQSDVLRNAGDDHSLSVFDTAIHNNTDRFVMRFKRR